MFIPSPGFHDHTAQSDALCFLCLECLWAWACSLCTAAASLLLGLVTAATAELASGLKTSRYEYFPRQIDIKYLGDSLYWLEA